MNQTLTLVSFDCSGEVTVRPGSSHDIPICFSSSWTSPQAPSPQPPARSPQTVGVAAIADWARVGKTQSGCLCDERSVCLNPDRAPVRPTSVAIESKTVRISYSKARAEKARASVCTPACYRSASLWRFARSPPMPKQEEAELERWRTFARHAGTHASLDGLRRNNHCR